MYFIYSVTPSNGRLSITAIFFCPFETHIHLFINAANGHILKSQSVCVILNNFTYLHGHPNQLCSSCHH